MKKRFVICTIILFFSGHCIAQTEPSAGNWKTWFISSGKDYRLPASFSHKGELAQVISMQ